MLDKKTQGFLAGRVLFFIEKIIFIVRCRVHYIEKKCLLRKIQGLAHPPPYFISYRLLLDEHGAVSDPLLVLLRHWETKFQWLQF